MTRTLPHILFLALILAPVHEARAFSIATIGGKEVRWQIDDVGYYLDSNGWSGINNGSDVAALTESFEDWEGISCSKLKFHKVANTSTSTVLPVGAAANGKNELIWKEGYWPFGNYVLGVTSPLYSFTGVISEADIAFNGTISWNTNGSMSYSVDVKSVGIHEIGHFFGLQHNLAYDENDPPTMAPYADPYGKSASLHQDDIDAICFLYPVGSYTCSSGSDCPYVVTTNSQGEEYYASHYQCSAGTCVPDSGGSGPGELGANCGDDGDCNNGLFCIQTTEGNWCTQWCSVSNQDCPDGFGCYMVEDNNDEGICFGGGGDGSFGDYCFGKNDCKDPYFCLPWWSGDICTKECTDVDGGTGCPAGYTCYPSADAPLGPGACYPGEVDKKADGKSCTYSSQCQSGLCFPNPGTTSKFCREACQPTNDTCPASAKCIGMPGDITGKKGGCIPLSLLPENADGDACSASWECASNYCYYDSELAQSTCRQLCNPSLGDCPDGTACMELGTDVGACLPAPDPQPEGAWCQHHYECTTGFCVALPGLDKKYCRNACTAGSGCKADFECIFYDDPDVGACMPIGKDLGEVCSSSTECTTQICWAAEGNSACQLPCVNGDCPNGFACFANSPYGPVCIPLAGAFEVGLSCVTDDQCKSGICLSEICRQACSVTAPTCPEGLGCVSLAAGDDGACVTPGARMVGATCSTDYECASLLCIESQGKRSCAIPCLPDGNTCASPQVCRSVPELNGLGACGDQPDTPVTEPEPEEEGNSEVPVAQDDNGGFCAVGTSGAALPGSLLLAAMALFIMAFGLRRKIW